MFPLSNFQACMEMSDTPPKVLSFINSLLFRQPLFMIEAPSFQFWVLWFPTDLQTVSLQLLVPLAQVCETLSQHCCLSVTSISEHKPGIPEMPLLLHLHGTFRLLYISAHVFVFKVNNKCNIKHPWLLQWTALSASCCKTDLILIVAGLWLN